VWDAVVAAIRFTTAASAKHSKQLPAENFNCKQQQAAASDSSISSDSETRQQLTKTAAAFAAAAFIASVILPRTKQQLL